MGNGLPNKLISRSRQIDFRLGLVNLGIINPKPIKLRLSCITLNSYFSLSLIHDFQKHKSFFQFFR